MEAFVLFARGGKDAIGRGGAEEDDDIGCASESSAAGSTSSDEVELAEDASSSGSAAGHFEMASLMTQLPIKRGLSKFFDGKSQSFASLAAVAGIEDLPKPPSAKRLKASRSCGAVGLSDAHRCRLSAAAACKKPSRARLSSSGPRRLVRARPPPAATPGAVPGQPLLFA
ncbi:hypothetical protein ACP4OV_031808 [Aristida adscensionis]